MPLDDPYASIAARASQLAERKRRLTDAMALTQQQIQGTPAGQMVGKFYVPNNAGAFLAPAIAQAVNLYSQHGQDREQRLLNAEEAQAATQLIQRLGGRDQTQELPGPTPDGAPLTGTTRVPLTPQEKLEAYQQGMQLPSLRASLTKAFEDQLIGAPSREEARAERRQTREDTQAAKRELLDANLALRREQLAEQQRQADQRAEDARLSREDRAQARQDANDYRQQMLDLRRQAIQDKHDNRRSLREEIEAAAAKEEAKADARERVKEQALGRTRALDASNALSALDRVDTLLKQGPTGSLAGTGIDTALGAVGLSTRGGQGAEALKVLSGELVSKMPKMSGPQSDKDVLLYKEMAGRVGDSTVPVAARQAAAKEVRRLQDKYKAAAPSGAVDFNSLR